jgi:hypothetical protein
MGLISAVVCVLRYRYDKQAGRPGSLDFRPRKHPSINCFSPKQSIFALINRFVQFFPSSLPKRYHFWLRLGREKKIFRCHIEYVGKMSGGIFGY